MGWNDQEDLEKVLETGWFGGNFMGISRNFMGFLGISWDFNGIERGFSEIEWDSHHGMTYFRNPKKG